VDESTIYAQYVLSNTYRAEEIEQKVESVRAKYGDTRAEATSEKETVRSSYLKAGLDKAKHNYGSVRRYLIKGVGLTTAQYAALRAKLQTS
jgi:protein-tyrosine phosphatase